MSYKQFICINVFNKALCKENLEKLTSTLVWGLNYSTQYWCLSTLIFQDVIIRGASLVVQVAKNLPAMRKTWVQSLGWEDPPGKGTYSCSCQKNSMDRGYSPWGHKESDTTEWLTHTHIPTHISNYSVLSGTPSYSALSFCNTIL